MNDLRTVILIGHLSSPVSGLKYSSSIGTLLGCSLTTVLFIHNLSNAHKLKKKLGNVVGGMVLGR